MDACVAMHAEYAESLHAVLGALAAGVISMSGAWPALAAALAMYLSLVALAVVLATTELRLPVVQYSNSAALPPGQVRPVRRRWCMQQPCPASGNAL